MHGAATAAARAAAKRRLADAAVRSAAVRFASPLEVDPVTALVTALQGAAGEHLAFQEELERRELAGDTVSEEFFAALRGRSTARAEMTRIAKDCVAVGLDLRREQVLEAEGRELFDELMGTLEELGLASEPVRALLAARLRARAAGRELGGAVVDAVVVE